MMLTSTNGLAVQMRSSRRRRAFTLIELMVVVAILGLMLFVVLPNLDSMLPGARVGGAARTVASTFEFVRSQSVFSGKPYEVQFNLDENWYQVILPEEIDNLRWNELPTMPSQYLPKGVKIRSIQFATGERKEDGVVKIRFSPFGQFDEFVLHVTEKGQGRGDETLWTVHFNPLTGIAEFYDGEKELERITEAELFQP